MNNCGSENCIIPDYKLYYAVVIWEDGCTGKERKDNMLIQATSYSEAFYKIEQEISGIIEANIRISSYNTSLGVFFLPENLDYHILSQLEEANDY